jgi:integrase
MKSPRFPCIIRSGSVTVTIYRAVRPATRRQKKREIFTLAWHSGGRRQTRQFADLRKATDEGRLKAEQMASGRVELAAAMTLAEAELLTAAKRTVGEVPLLTALEEWKKGRKLCQGSFLRACELWAETQSSNVELATAEEASRRFLDAKRKAGVDTTAGLERTMPKFLKQFGSQALNTISSKALQAWLDEMAHPSTRNSHRKRLVTFFRWARKRGLLPSAALTEIEKTDRAKEKNLEIGIITVEQFADILRLIRAKHPEFLAAAVLAGFCGLRRKEIQGQSWKDVLLDRGFVRVTSAKANTPAKRLAPLCPAAVEWLMMCDRSKEQLSPAWAMDRIRAFCRDAEPPIPCPENGFRHAFISHRVAATGDLATTALESGNSVRIIHAHYRELVAKDDGLSWFGIAPSQQSEKVVQYASKECT